MAVLENVSMNDTNDNLDAELRILVKNAQQYPPTSRERRKALDRLIKTIIESGELNTFKKWRSHPYYQDMYQDALSRTYIEISKKIDNYYPEKRVMAWVNQVLKWRFIDVLRERKQEEEKWKQFLDNYLCPVHEKQDKEMESLRKFIDKDPEKILQNTHIRNNHQANLQIILQMRLNEEGWKSIAKKLDTKLSTVSGFYQDQMERQNILDYFRKYL
jgi:DNA-directed RNA polymerase specialized sigma24 family protein